MFSPEPRCIYRSNQLGEVICQLRFPEILSISVNPPAAFQDAIRAEYPQYSLRREAPAPKITGTPGNMSLENAPTVVNHQFVSEDGCWRVNLTSTFISLSCCKYTQWEDFARKLDKPLVAFIKTYKPAYFERVGLRYLNFISRNALNLSNTPFRELITPAYLGLLTDDDVNDSMVTMSNLNTEVNIRGGCKVKIHTGPGLVKKNGQGDNEIRFIFDQDLYMPGKVPVNMSAGALQILHSQAWAIFRGAITDTLHEAMNPNSV